MTVKRMDNVGIVVEDLDAAIEFFTELGLELEGRAPVEGDWADGVTGLRDMRVEIAMMRTPDGHSRLEMSRFVAPPVVADHRSAPVNALGYLRVMFTVEDIDDTLTRLGKRGAKLVGRLKVDVTDKAFAMYKHAYEEKTRADVEKFKREYCHDTPVRLVGVWDTVGALGIPDEFFIPGLRKVDKAIDAKLYGFLDTDLSPRVEAAYHAVAIDEHRKPFLPTLWTDAPGAAPRVNVAGSKVEQVWFTGAHSNVGGGYADSGLSDIALKWMVDRASVNGLQFALAVLRLDPKAKRRDSLEEFVEVGGEKKNRFFAWIDKIATRFVSVNRPIANGSCVHASVEQRLAAPMTSEPRSDSPYSPAATLKIRTRGGVRSVDPQFRMVS